MISRVLSEDLNTIVNDENIPWDILKNTTVLVTGSTGLVGRNIVLALNRANKLKALNIKIVAHGRSKQKLQEIFNEIDNVDYLTTDICFPFPVLNNVDYIFHCAAITKSSEMQNYPVDVIKISLLGTINILDVLDKNKIKGMVYLSSMEAYGNMGEEDVGVNEKDLGVVPIDSVRSCYPQSKRMCENLCYCHFKQYDTPVKIARLAQTFGAGVPADDTRVFADFARKAMNKEDIILHTKGETLGNYCYLSDTIAALIIILLKGDNGEIYNVSNQQNSVSIKEMADIVAKSAGVKVRYKPMENKGYALITRFILNADKLTRIGWKPQYLLKEMYSRMMDDWRENA